MPFIGKHKKKLSLVRFKALLYLLLLFGVSDLRAQKVDDTAGIMKMIDAGSTLMSSSPDSAFNFFSDALSKSERTGFKRGIAVSSAKLGRWYFGNDVGKSISLAKRSINLFEENKSGTVDDIADMHLLLAEAYDEQGQKDSSAYFYYLLGEEMDAGNIKDPEFAVVVFTKLTIFWLNLDYGSLVNEEYKKTVRRFVEKASQASQRIKDSADAVSSVYFIKGAYHHGIKEFDSARYYYFNYIEARERLHKLNLARKVSTLFNISDTYLQEKNPQEALKYIDQIKDIGKDPKNIKYLAFYTSFIDLLTAKAHFQMKDYKGAISIQDKALADLKLTGTHFRNEIVESYDIYAKSYEALGDYRKALEYKNTYTDLYDSLTKKDKVDIISRLEVRNHMAEKDKELAEQKLAYAEVNTKIKTKNFWIMAILFLVLSAVIIFGLWRKRNISRQILQEERIGNLQQKIKIERLKASITGEEKERTRIGRELHDGIGGLLSVARMNFELVKKTSLYKESGDFNDGMQLLEEAAIELRKSAYNLMPEVLLTQGLPAAVQAFCEKMMSKGSTVINFQCIGHRPDIPGDFDLPLYRIIQELVHNIIKHAKAKHALIQLYYQDNGTIDITIEDDGIGLSEDAFEKPMSMGLKNIKDRVNDLGGKLDIQSSAETGTGIYLEFESFKEEKTTT